jgi:hypothetical protein
MDSAIVVAIIGALATIATPLIAATVAGRKGKEGEQDKGSKPIVPEPIVPKPILPKAQLPKVSPKLAVQKDGRFIGGTDAVRKVALTLLDTSWDGDLTVDSEAIEAVKTELEKLKSLSTLSAEEGDRPISPTSDLAVGQAALARVITALRLTFVSASPRERTWGTSMKLEDATIFIESLFVYADLAARSDGDWTNCWVYLPAFKEYRYHKLALLPETDKQVALDKWHSELKRNLRLTEQWSDVLPVLAFPNQSIVRYLLPAIVLELVENGMFEQTESVTEFWNHLTESYPPEDDRDPLNPFDWCVAFDPDANLDDLKWRTSTPPKSIAALREYINELQKET